ncbi:MAG: hypothetical protein ACD_26C00140G0002 [uncultured bacterium]|nr:MAG: hypothetical protein ACD_26C00140G0002 [uncultured bacterium]HAO52011.1 hypothetical protein [Candidatus Magasanikbacteria bacterium]
MPKIQFSEFAVLQIKKFVHLYEEGFFLLYKDSGLWAEDTIIENYRKTALELNNRIFTEIDIRLSKDVVLGRKELETLFEISFYIGDRLIIVYFSDQKETDVRLVESIEIDRKPIIF